MRDDSGCITAQITDEPIDTARVLREVSDAAHGAALLFLGVVRDHNEGRAVLGIRYEAYRDMAEAELLRIAREAAGDRPARVSLTHRVGDLKVDDVSLAVAVSTPHRADSYELSRTILEEIKRRVPVWKFERYADGAEEWLSGVTPGGGSPGDSPSASAASPGATPT
ncbi:MAG: molybdenum cofactor biosynthesis protein MoaE [Gemmatimonadota bacterium]